MLSCSKEGLLRYCDVMSVCALAAAANVRQMRVIGFLIGNSICGLVSCGRVLNISRCYADSALASKGDRELNLL